MPYLGIFRQEFQKAIVLFEIHTPKFAELQSLVEK